MGAFFVRQLSDHAAILAVLIPAEASIGDGFRADVLKAAQNGVLFGNLKRLTQNLDFYQPFIGAKYLSCCSIRRRFFGYLRFRLL